MQTITKPERKSARDVAYYTQRYRNRVHAKLISFVGDQLEKRGWSKKDIAEALDRDPAQVSRWLSQPSNLSLDTVSMFALAFDAEPEPPEFVEFKDRRAPNYVHPLIARVTNAKELKPKQPMPIPLSESGEPTILSTGERFQVLKVLAS